VVARDRHLRNGEGDAIELGLAHLAARKQLGERMADKLANPELAL
jgi:hypothetical protein